MYGSVRLFDYRCFRRESPATLELHRGFTAFVGANNAGKSALIRSLYELRAGLHELAQKIATDPNRTVSGSFSLPLVSPMAESNERVCDRIDPEPSVEISVASSEAGLYLQTARLTLSVDGSSFHTQIIGSDGRTIAANGGATPFVAGLEGKNWPVNDGLRYASGPLVELLRIVAGIQYVGPFRNALNEGAGGHFDSQIGTGFIEQWNQWKSGPSKFQNRAVERVTGDVRRLIGVEKLEINASSDKKTLQVIVDGRPYRLQELGSGISQLIVVLGNALIRPSTFIVIDEPEIHLHPGLQAEFLTTLASYAECGVIFATHSIGLARSVGDHCYSVQRIDGNTVVRELSRTPHYAEFLGSLGIAGLQEIGWDRVLLVEGPKDVRTLQQLLRLYGKDRKTVVLPLGGDSMINGKITEELSEVVRLSEHVFAIVDSERKAAGRPPIKARVDFAAVCAELHIKCCTTELRAIENYVPQSALDRAFFGRNFKPLPPYGAPGESGEFWGKGESWRAAQHMKKEDLASTDLGQFLEAL